MLRRPILSALLAVATASAAAQAQSSPSNVKVSGGITSGKTLVVTADQPSHFAVFAIGKGFAGNPIQVLTNASPTSHGTGRPTRRLEARALTAAQLSRFAPSSEVVVVALAAATPPRLDDFTIDGRWANDLVLADSTVSDGKQLVHSIAEVVFGKDVRYAARLMPVELAGEMPVAFRTITDACGRRVESAAPASSPQEPASSTFFNPSYSAVPPATFARANDRGSDEGLGRYAVGVLQLPGCSEWVYRAMPEPTPSRPSHPRVPTTPAVPSTVPEH